MKRRITLLLLLSLRRLLPSPEKVEPDYTFRAADLRVAQAELDLRLALERRQHLAGRHIHTRVI